jgi:hypothetical protein
LDVTGRTLFLWELQQREKRIWFYDLFRPILDNGKKNRAEGIGVTAWSGY